MRVGKAMGRNGNAFDIMRLRRTIVSIGAGLGCFAALVAPAVGWASVAAGSACAGSASGAVSASGAGSASGSGSASRPDSVPAIGAESYWLPLPVEEIETPEALDDP